MTTLSYAIADSIGCIEIANPPYNTLTDPVFEDEARLREFLGTPALKAVIVKGKGRHFCHGADLDSMRRRLASAGVDQFRRELDKGKKLLGLIASATVPTLACIRGGCLGAGLELALACHFRYAAESALIGFPEAAAQLMPGFGGTQASLPALARSRLIELILSAKLISGQDALASGLIDACASPRDIEAHARAFLHSLTDQRSHRLIRSVMESIHNSRLTDGKHALEQESRLFLELVRAGSVTAGGQ